MSAATIPILKDLLADPQKFPDAMKYTAADGKETTLGELRKVAAVAAGKSLEAPESPNAATDKRVAEILEANKKKKKHPVEARIGELTKKAADLEQQRLTDKKEFEAKL